MRRWKTERRDDREAAVPLHREVYWKHSVRNHEMVHDGVEIYEKVKEQRTPK